ncbi:hypothetical protein EZJ58_3369 [Sodalis ligni]|uniref:Uncharacterized protein n=1 Tax=Sodalis ligni TaxID=2697027 RepID=A0A4R1NCD3_9GAMM|nr:hypothetical protein EZJ58_3369 [Sodalis ligni]
MDAIAPRMSQAILSRSLPCVMNCPAKPRLYGNACAPRRIAAAIAVRSGGNGGR